jgi:hypothetical protein
MLHPLLAPRAVVAGEIDRREIRAGPLIQNGGES